MFIICMHKRTNNWNNNKEIEVSLKAPDPNLLINHTSTSGSATTLCARASWRPYTSTTVFRRRNHWDTGSHNILQALVCRGLADTSTTLVNYQAMINKLVRMRKPERFSSAYIKQNLPLHCFKKNKIKDFSMLQKWESKHNSYVS